MEIAHVHISGVKAELMQRKGERWEIPSGIIGATIRFTFDPEWDSLSKTVVFQGCDRVKDVVGIKDQATVPPEVVSSAERKLRVGVYGVDGDGKTATPTLWVEGYIKPAAAPSGDTSVDETLPVWAQMEARLSDLERQYGIEIDASLTEAGYAADAKSVGDRFAALVPLGYLEIDETLAKSGQAADAKAAGDALNGKLSVSGGSMTGDIAMSGKKVTGLGDPTASGDAVSLGYARKAFAPAVESTDHPGCYYRTVAGVSEWINPPMVAGVEYRTTERYLGKPVYAKAVSLGTLPNTAQKTVTVLSSVGGFAVSAEFIMHISDSKWMVTKHPNVSLSVQRDSYGWMYVNIVTTSDMSGYDENCALVKYTKSTD